MSALTIGDALSKVELPYYNTLGNPPPMNEEEERKAVEELDRWLKLLGKKTLEETNETLKKMVVHAYHHLLHKMPEPKISE